MGSGGWLPKRYWVCWEGWRRREARERVEVNSCVPVYVFVSAWQRTSASGGERERNGVRKRLKKRQP